MMYFLLKLIASLALFVGLQKLCELKTRGFCVQRILADDLPPVPAWNTPPQKEEEIQALLDQPYFLIGSGGECFAFASADGRVVAKFYKLNMARFMYLRKGLCRVDHSEDAGTLSNHWLCSAPLPHFLDHARKRFLGMREFRLKRLFQSTLLAYEELREETGLLYVHLNPTEHFTKPLVLVDALGISHTIDPNTTKFVLQRKAEPLLAHFDRLMQEGNEEKAKQGIDSFLSLIRHRCQKGIADHDIYMRNFGFLEDRAIEIDLGPFAKDETMQIPEELALATRELNAYFCKKHPTLHHYLTDALSSVSSSQDRK